MNPMPETTRGQSYVLVTAAYNEEKFIEAVIHSVIAQTTAPLKWVIVSDGSTDRTDQIVSQYTEQYPFIHLFRISEDHPRNFAAQVHAINAGIAQMQNQAYAFMGNLDADITLECDYFERLLGRFEGNPHLGLAGGEICERAPDGSFLPRGANSRDSVAHAVQLFRRECFEAIGGGYEPLPYGGPDTYAETMARMKGWEVTSVAGLKAFHHRPTGSAGGVLNGYYRMGKMDYSLGYLFAFEVARIIRRVSAKPYLVGASVRFAGFLSGYLRGQDRAVSREFIDFFQSQQRRRLWRVG
ncbi:MAG: glycosyltransferase family A protein [Candidatus Korobacteraceae bacterium]